MPIASYIEQHKDKLISLIQKIVAIPSIKGLPSTQYPFGEKIGQCLDTALDEAKRMGFHVKNLNGYVGYAEYGEGDYYIGIIGHLDVVPEGDGWAYPPFGGEIHEGVLYGRGVLDNKAPILSCLFAIKTLIDLNINFPYKVRVIFGTDEESGFHDIPHYLEYENPPIMGFTPDCKFPVVYGENGIFRANISASLSQDKLVTLYAINGPFTPANVPDYCELIFQCHDITKIQQITKNLTNYQIEDTFIKIIAHGERAPSNNPYLGKNAILKALQSLPQEFLDYTNITDFVQVINNNLQDLYGKQLNVDFSDPETGNLMITVYSLELLNDRLSLYFSVRYPVNCTVNIKTFEKTFAPYHFTVSTNMPAINFPINHPMVKSLNTSFCDITGMQLPPTTTTGGTYAKIMPNIVAFGPSFPGERGIAHNKNEYMSIDHIILMTKIYAHAIVKLFDIPLEEIPRD